MCSVCGKITTETMMGQVCRKCRKAKTQASRESRRGKGQCPICGTRPKVKGGLYCHICNENVRASSRSQKPWWSDAIRFAVWRGYGVAFMPDPNADSYTAKALNRSDIKRLPKDDRTVNLDGYCKGYKPEQVRRIKAAIMRVHALKVKPR